MTTNALALASLSLLAAACTDPTYPELQDAPSTPVETSQVARADTAPVVIATGGTQGFAIDDPTSIGIEGLASDGYRVEPTGNVWPAMVEPLYWVRALGAGTGTFEIQTNNGIASGLVESADVATIALVPADYRLDGSSAFAIDTNRLAVQVVLADAQGRRLVDATLGISGEQTAWDRATRPAIVGKHLVRVYADSFGDRELHVDVVGQVDRVESSVNGNITCFHAYTGATEIATALTIDGGTPVAGASNCVADAPIGTIAIRR